VVYLVHELGLNHVNFFFRMTLTNNVDGQHMLSNLPNGPVTNGIMTYAIPSEGNSVTDHGYNERVSHLTPDSVISQVAPDTSGSTPLNAHENGHDQQEQYNESSLSAAESSPVEESNLPERQLSEEKCERDMNKVEGNVPQEEKAPETESRDPGLCLDAHAEQKSSEEEKPELASEQSKNFCAVVVRYTNPYFQLMNKPYWNSRYEVLQSRLFLFVLSPPL